MKQTIDYETGEVIDVEETNDIALRKANELVDIDKAVELYEAMEIAKINYENFVATFKKPILDILRELPKGEQKIVGEYITFMRRDGYLRETFDNKKFKNDCPELYQKYASITAVDESLVIKVKK